ncbi:MAG TPA: type II secretion system protein GspL [Rhodocyclaceae bacterium]|nr:type II secretion system protein GspL [Rhodocyclaceae bacterium]
MTTLRILISDAWPDQAEAPWVVLDQNRIVSSGQSAPANWPRAARTEAILTGAQVGWAQARLPQAKAREQLRALPFAMEEQLLREPDSQHFTPAYRDGENWSVLVIARERLKRLTAQFAALGRPLDAAWSALACLPLTPDGWTLAIDATHCLLRTSPARAVIDDAPPPDSGADALPAIISMLLAQAHAQGSLPARIVTMGAGSEITTALAAHQLEVVPEMTWPWHSVPDDAANLLHGEFRAAHARGELLRGLRPALILVAVVLVAHLVLGIGSALLRQHDLKEIKSRMTQLARTQLPGRALQDPALQLHRELQSQRQRRAQLADDDALALLSDLAVALGSDATASLQAVHYDGGSLVVTLAKPLDVPALQSRLSARGVQSAVRNANVLALQRSAS